MGGVIAEPPGMPREVFIQMPAVSFLVVPGQVAMKGFGLLELETELCKDSSVQKQRA